MSSQSRSPLRGMAAMAIGVIMAAGIGGCVMVQDCCSQNWAATAEITTPSVDAVRASGAKPTVSQRGYAVIEVPAVDGTVTHTPLFFEDPHESTVDDGRFAWSGADYHAIIYGPARFLVNMALVPLSAIDTPPWQIMGSDGNMEERSLLREPFDAKPCCN